MLPEIKLVYYLAPLFDMLCGFLIELTGSIRILVCGTKMKRVIVKEYILVKRGIRLRWLDAPVIRPGCKLDVRLFLLKGLAYKIEKSDKSSSTGSLLAVSRSTERTAAVILAVILNKSDEVEVGFLCQKLSYVLKKALDVFGRGKTGCVPGILIGVYQAPVIRLPSW